MTIVTLGLCSCAPFKLEKQLIEISSLAGRSLETPIELAIETVSIDSRDQRRALRRLRPHFYLDVDGGGDVWYSRLARNWVVVRRNGAECFYIGGLNPERHKAKQLHWQMERPLNVLEIVAGVRQLLSVMTVEAFDRWRRALGNAA